MRFPIFPVIFYYTVNSYPLFLGKSQKNRIIRAIGNRPYFHQGDVTISYIDLSDTCAPWSCIRRNITAIIPHLTLYMMFPQIINASISVSAFGRWSVTDYTFVFFCWRLEGRLRRRRSAAEATVISTIYLHADAIVAHPQQTLSEIKGHSLYIHPERFSW